MRLDEVRLDEGRGKAGRFWGGVWCGCCLNPQPPEPYVLDQAPHPPNPYTFPPTPQTFVSALTGPIASGDASHHLARLKSPGLSGKETFARIRYRKRPTTWAVAQERNLSYHLIYYT